MTQLALVEPALADLNKEPFGLSPSTSLRTGLSKPFAMRTLLTAVTLLSLLCACASPSSDTVGSAPTRIEISAVDPALAAYEQRHRQAAKTASNDGRLADALWHWDIVLALHPQDEAVRRQRTQLQDRAQAQAQDRMNRAQQAQQQGNTEGAQRLYMEALAAQPTHRAAADALREMERQRTRRGQVNASFTMKANIGKTAAATPKGAKSKSMGTGNATPDERNEAEHSSLMLMQDDANADSAARTRTPTADATSTGSGQAASTGSGQACERAPRLEATDTKAAIKAWRECMAAKPGDERAAARLRELQARPM
jgi:hypothetical protein